jgi:hypothetical protein
MQVPGSIEELLQQAGAKLNINAEKAFTEGGAQLDDVRLIRDDEKLFISSGEPFFKSSDTRVRQYKVAVIGSGGVGKSCLVCVYLLFVVVVVVVGGGGGGVVVVDGSSTDDPQRRVILTICCVW